MRLLVIFYAVAAVMLSCGAAAQGSPSVLSAAQTWQGTPYLLGGAGNPSKKGPSGPGIDCSHLVWRALQSSVSPAFPYTSTSAWAAKTPAGFKTKSCTNLQNGDIIQFASHMGVSSGPGAIYSATTSKGVRNGQISWFGKPTACYGWTGK